MNRTSLKDIAAKRAADYLKDAASAMRAETPPAERITQLRQAIGKTVSLPLDEITIKENVRKTVERDEEFEALIRSVSEDGVRQSLQVELRVNSGGYELICVAGQRRILAAREARRREEQAAKKERRAPQLDKLLRVPALILAYDDPALRTLDGLIENMLRRDLPPIDIAKGYARLRENGWTAENIAVRFGRNARTVRKYLKIADYPAEAEQTIRNSPALFTSTVLLNEFASRQFPDDQTLCQAFTEFVTANAIETARESRLKEKGSNGKAKAARPKKSPGSEFTRSLEQKIRAALPLKINVTGSAGKGKVTFTYRSDAELALLLKIIKKPPRK